MPANTPSDAAGKNRTMKTLSCPTSAVKSTTEPTKISIVASALSTATQDATPGAIIADISGGKYRRQIEHLRPLVAAGKTKEAGEAKKLLPAVMWSGKFKRRSNDALEAYSGLLCADVDKVGAEAAERLLCTLSNDPHVAGGFISPSGNGLKVVFRVSDDPAKHGESFAAVRHYMREHYSVTIDEACKDVSRLCFVSYDEGAFWKEAEPLAPLPETVATIVATETQARELSNGSASRAEIAARLLGPIQWQNHTTGLCRCPGAHLHTTANGERDCTVKLDGSPTVFCFHDSCRGVIAGINHELRSQIAKAEFRRPEPTSKKSTIVDTPEAQLPAIVDASDFIAQPLEKPAELVAGLLHKGSKLVLGGGSKSFKTWTLLDLAISVSHGLPWIGFDTAPGNVAYVNFEIQPWSWQARLAAVEQARHITLEHGRLSLWNLRGKAANFNLLLPQIRERVKQDFALIILDPIYKLYGQTDENSAGDVAQLLNAIEDLAVETGAAVAFGAHFSKGNQAAKESIDRISGSGVFARDPDSLLVFTKHEEQDAFTVEATLRNFAPVEPFVVRWQYPLMVPDQQLDPSKLKQSGGRKRVHTPDSLLELLGDQSLTATEWAKLAKNELGVGNGTFYELLRELRKLERVIQSRVNGRYQRVLKR